MPKRRPAPVTRRYPLANEWVRQLAALVGIPRTTLEFTERHGDSEAGDSRSRARLYWSSHEYVTDLVLLESCWGLAREVQGRAWGLGTIHRNPDDAEREGRLLALRIFAWTRAQDRVATVLNCFLPSAPMDRHLARYLVLWGTQQVACVLLVGRLLGVRVAAIPLDVGQEAIRSSARALLDEVKRLNGGSVCVRASDLKAVGRVRRGQMIDEDVFTRLEGQVGKAPHQAPDPALFREARASIRRARFSAWLADRDPGTLRDFFGKVNQHGRALFEGVEDAVPHALLDLAGMTSAERDALEEWEHITAEDRTKRRHPKISALSEMPQQKMERGLLHCLGRLCRVEPRSEGGSDAWLEEALAGFRGGLDVGSLGVEPGHPVVAFLPRFFGGGRKLERAEIDGLPADLRLFAELLDGEPERVRAELDATGATERTGQQWQLLGLTLVLILVRDGGLRGSESADLARHAIDEAQRMGCSDLRPVCVELLATLPANATVKHRSLGPGTRDPKEAWKIRVPSAKSEARGTPSHAGPGVASKKENNMSSGICFGKGGGGKGGSAGGGKGSVPNGPSQNPGQPSGGGRGNAPPGGAK